jgi:O-succinylbenzoic acid--CoA ligase
MGGNIMAGFDNSISINNNFCSNLSYAANVMRFYEEWKNASETITANTSGSTGKPKEIQIQKKAMRVSAQQTIDYFEIKEGQNLLLCLPIEFIAGKMMVVRCIVAKAHLVISEPSSNPLLSLITNKPIPIDFAAFTPFQVAAILENPITKKIFTGIKTIIIGGGEINAKLEKNLATLDKNIYATYGMTETITHIAVRKIGAQSNAIYKAFKEINLGLDPRNCLTIQANYLGKDPIITNDIVEFEGPKEFVFLGRVDNVINSGGIKLHPEKIEAKINSILDETFFVHYKSDEELGQKIILVIERSEAYDATTLGLLKNSLKDILEKYEVPKEIVFVKEFKRTDNGKVNRGLSILGA